MYVGTPQTYLRHRDTDTVTLRLVVAFNTRDTP
jgi:hypothetical protein